MERKFVSERELAAITSISPRTWQKHRLFGRGPKFYKIVGAIRYELHEVLAWIEDQASSGCG